MFAKSIPSSFQGLSTSRLAQRMRKALSLLVLIASLAALALIVRDQHAQRFVDLHKRFLSLDVLQPDAVSANAAVSGNTYPEDGRYRAIAEFLAKKYKVSHEVTLDLVSIAHAAGHQLGVDPLLIIAVMAVESRFNPIAESVAGAKGLMQVIPKYHTEKFEEFGGEKAVFDPETNILVGSQILRDNLRRTGNLSMALQMYAGALNDEQDLYSSRVMNEKQRLQRVVSQLQPRTPAKTASARSVVLQVSPLTP